MTFIQEHMQIKSEGKCYEDHQEGRIWNERHLCVCTLRSRMNENGRNEWVWTVKDKYEHFSLLFVPWDNASGVIPTCSASFLRTLRREQNKSFRTPSSVTDYRAYFYKKKMEKFKNSHQRFQIQKCSHEHVTLPLGNFSPFFSPRVRWTQLPPRSIDGVAGRRQPLSGRVAVGGRGGAGWPVLGVEKPAAPSSAMSVWRETLKRSDACRCVLCVHTEQVLHTAITFDWNFVVSVSACTLDTDMFNDQCLRIWVKQRLSFVFFFYSLNGYILRRFGFQRQHTKKKSHGTRRVERGLAVTEFRVGRWWK